MDRQHAALWRILGISAILLTLVLAAHGQHGIDGLRLLGRNEDEPRHLMDAYLAGDYVYLSNGLGEGFQTYNIADPTQPTLIDRQGLSSWRVWARGDTAFSFCHQGGVQVFDISQPTPVLLGAYNPTDFLVSYEDGLRVADLLYVAAHQMGVHVLDVSAGTPTWLRSIALGENASWSIRARGDHLFVANGRNGVSVLVRQTEQEIATLPLPGLANDLELSADGQTLFVSLASAGIAAVDISDPEEPLLVDLVPTLGNAFTLGRQDNRLAVGSYAYLESFDVSHPHQLELNGWDATKVYALGADAGRLSGGDSVIVTADWRGFAVYGPAPDPTGDIEVYPLRLDFGEVTASRDTMIEVRNSGAGPLQVTQIAPPAGIVATPSSLQIAPGQTAWITVTATGSQPVWSRIYYYSDDPDEPVFVQYVYMNNTGFLQIGSPAPDFTLIGRDEQSYTLSAERGKVVLLQFGGVG